MDAKLQAHLTTLIPKLATGVMRDARRDLASLWNQGQEGGGSAPIPFDREDVQQEMWVAAVDRETRLTEHLANGNTHAIAVILKRAGKNLATQEKREIRAKKAKLAGYEPMDEQFYSVGSLRRLLPMYLDGGVTETPPAGRELSGHVSGGGSGGYGDYLIVMADVDVAFNSLPAGKRKILARYFSYPQGSGGWTHTEIASAMGMPPGQLSGRVHYALRALQSRLGGAP
jgi:hypothetical protein